MRRLFGIVMSMICVLGLFIGSSAMAFDKLPSVFKEFLDENEYVDLCTTIVDISTMGIAEGIYPDTKNREKNIKGIGTFSIEGVGGYLGNGYIITVAHVVIPDEVTIQEGKNFYWRATLTKVIDKIILIGGSSLLDGNIPATVVYISEEYDFAVLKLIGDWPAGQKLDYPMASTVWKSFGESGSLIGKGDAIAMITRRYNDEDGTREAWYEVRYGTVIAPKPILPPNNYTPDEIVWFNMNDFTIKLDVHFGDSGTPLFAFNNGKPVIIGIVRALYPTEEHYSYATRIDLIKNYMSAQ